MLFNRLIFLAPAFALLGSTNGQTTTTTTTPFKTTTPYTTTGTTTVGTTTTRTTTSTTGTDGSTSPTTDSSTSNPTSSPTIPPNTPTTSTTTTTTTSNGGVPTDFPTGSPISPYTCVFAQKVKIELATGNPLHMFDVQVFSGDSDAALGMPATQSSTLKGNDGKFGASNAVDGVSTSISHTDSGANEWWEVELNPSASVPVDSLTIMNRWCGDPNDASSCLCRMSEAQVNLYDESGNVTSSVQIEDTCGKAVLNFDFLCSPTISPAPTTFPTYSQTDSPPTSSACTIPGRQIKITSITGEPLHMFEVQAWAGDVNAALNKPATQGSDLKGNPDKFGASKAVDGNEATFSHTDVDCVWWEVDLESSYDISSITIKNRFCEDSTDSPGCLCRLSHAAVSIVDNASGDIAKIFLGDMCGELEGVIDVGKMEGSSCETSD